MDQSRALLSPWSRVLSPVAAIITAALAVTLLTPAPSASADEQPPPATITPAVTQTVATTTNAPEPDRVIDLGGTDDYSFYTTLEESFPDSLCSDNRYPWAQITDESTGETEWMSPWGDEFRTDDLRFRYPGTTLTLRLFEPGEPDEYTYCYVHSRPEDASGLTLISEERIELRWEKPEILDVQMRDYEGEPTPAIKFSPGWTDADSSQIVGGAQYYRITDYNLPNQRALPISGHCYMEDDGYCYLPYTVMSGDTLGIAALPSNIDAETSSEWPVDGAIDSYLWTTDEGGPSDIKEVTQAGPSESTICTRVCTGDPIDTFTGNFFENQVDMSIPGRIGLEIERRYAVQNRDNVGAFGPGWALNYDMRLDDSGYYTIVTEPSGNELPFSFSYITDKMEPRTPAIRAELTETSTGWIFHRIDERTDYVFDTNGALTEIRDENGNVVSLTHTNGELTRVTEGDRYIDLVWDGDLLQSVTDHTGRTVEYGYDSDDRLTEVTDVRGHDATYAYDTSDRMTQMVFADGGVTTNEFDTKHRLTTQVLPDGKTLELSYGTENSGRVTNVETIGDEEIRYTYYRGRIVERTSTADPEGDFRRSYNDNGDLAYEVAFNGVPTRTINSYDAERNLVTSEEMNSGAIQRFEYDSERRVVAHTDPAGMRTESVYDTAGNLTQTTVIPTDGSTARVTSSVYDAEGDLTSMTNPLGGVTGFSYNDAGEVTQQTDPLGGITSFTLDDLGRVTTQVDPGGTAAGATPEDVTAFTTEMTYDEAGNTLTVTSDGETTTYVYDERSRAISVTDPRGKTEATTYDLAGRPISMLYPDGSTDTFTYDIDTGDRASWTDPQGLTTQYRSEGWSSTVVSPDGTETTTTRSVDRGTVTTVLTDPDHPNGITLSRESAQEMVLTGGTETITQKRDAAGRVTSETAGGQTITSSYDGFGQLVSQSGTDRDVSYGYDLAGNITEVEYPDGSVVTRELDAAGRVTDITDWAGGLYEFSYTAAGQIAGLSAPGDVDASFGYDGTRVSSKTWTNGAGQALGTFAANYGTGGLMSSDEKNSAKRDFSWSDTGAVTGVNADPVSWDSRLLTGFANKTLSYDTATSRLTSSANGSLVTSYTYDAQGNRLTAGSTSYSWNAFGRLEELDSTSYRYGADGIRTSVDGAAQVYDQGLKLLSDGSHKYLWGPDGALLAQSTLGNTAQVELAITDQMGTVYSVLDGTGTLLASYSYSLFGERALVSGTDVTDIGFTSEQHDASGLIYLRHRYLDPAVGQFISVDPMVTSTLDPYGYADGNPLQVVDPLGLFSWDWDFVDALVDNIGTTAAVVGLGALAVGLTVATGGAAAVFIGGVAMASTGIGALSAGYSAVRKCYFGGTDKECGWSLAGAALSAVPGVSASSKWGTLARAPRPTNGSVHAMNQWSERRTLGALGYLGGNSHGLAFDALNRYCN